MSLAECDPPRSSHGAWPVRSMSLYHDGGSRINIAIPAQPPQSVLKPLEQPPTSTPARAFSGKLSGSQ